MTIFFSTVITNVVNINILFFGQTVGGGGSAGPHQPFADTLHLTCYNKERIYAYIDRLSDSSGGRVLDCRSIGCRFKPKTKNCQ